MGDYNGDGWLDFSILDGSYTSGNYGNRVWLENNGTDTGKALPTAQASPSTALVPLGTPAMASAWPISGLFTAAASSADIDMDGYTDLVYVYKYDGTDGGIDFPVVSWLQHNVTAEHPLWATISRRIWL